MSKLLADLLGGKRVERAEVITNTAATSTDSSSANIVAPTESSIESDQALIYSRLAGSEKLAPVVEKFIVRVREQFTLIEAAHQRKDHEELAALAHWLKGSGGTVGFDELLKPAKLLEDHAKAADSNACDSDLAQINSIIGRLRAGTGTSAGQEESSIQTQESKPVAVDIVESSLLQKNPSFRPIVMKFLPRLNTQMEAMDKAMETKDFEEVAALAHWLKGSGGTVGFDVFTTPATKMETAAKSGDGDTVKQCLIEIKDFASKIVIPGNDDESDLQKQA